MLADMPRKNDVTTTFFIIDLPFHFFLAVTFHDYPALFASLATGREVFIDPIRVRP